ncbi:uncharacterized protein RCC_05078 [Ramularia collo-cygni]|uniref:DUF1746 domain-containing protein n=1 Tax=Ramularia collo-cygni TaxID=112498 RepID=A0A2D3UQM5_9PEZI|nr:uncharacterized protein RCC_05078 [Ramularia collo-cygni]CZT19232.1 uncharacterized protein RCC_05078 [Ramularia collo-cygni]
MNDESAFPSSSAPSTSAPSAPNYADDVSTHHNQPQHEQDQREQQQPGATTTRNLTPSQITARRKRNLENFNQRRVHLLEDLLKGLDVLVFAEVGVGYYFDCSTPLLLLRSAIQFIYLTPKNPLFPAPPSGTRVLGIVCLVGCLSVLFHVWRGVGSGVDRRGYLHGGLVLDFIGQEDPGGCMGLVGLDLLVVGLQVLCCAVKRVRERVLGEGASSSSSSSSVAGGERGGGRRTRRVQGVEDEERGVRGSEERVREEGVEMERLNLNSNSSGTEAAAVESEEEEQDRIELLERSDARIFDAFNSGQIVLADLQLGELFREEWRRSRRGDGEDKGDAGDGDDDGRRRRDLRRRLVERVRGRIGGL